MNVLGYQLSANFVGFYETQKAVLGLKDIIFVSMAEHHGQKQYGHAYGTTELVEDDQILNVYLNPDCINSHPAETRDNVAESIAVHEILHQWTKAKGFPEVRGADIYPALTERFTNLFHHRVVNKEMKRWGYDTSVPDRLVAQQFRNALERETSGGPLPTYDSSYLGFALYIMILATALDQFTSSEFEGVVSFFATTNPEIIRRSYLCFNLIEESQCWESPTAMFEVMEQVRDILELTSNILDFKNPETGEWTDRAS